MIRFNDNLVAETYHLNGWRLIHSYMGKERETGAPKKQQKVSYYATLSQVCDAVVERVARDCDAAGHLREELEMAARTIEVEVLRQTGEGERWHDESPTA